MREREKYELRKGSTGRKSKKQRKIGLRKRERKKKERLEKGTVKGERKKEKVRERGLRIWKF